MMTGAKLIESEDAMTTNSGTKLKSDVADAELHQLTHTSVYRIGEAFYNVHTSRFGTEGHLMLGPQMGGFLLLVLTAKAANIMWTDAWFIATGLHVRYQDHDEVRAEAEHACEVFTTAYNHTSRYDGYST